MTRKGLVAAAALLVLSAACGDSTQASPATAPPTAAVATTTPPTSTVATTTSTSTTTTALSPQEARLAEIEEIFRDLEFRRLDALYRNDEEAFRELFANEAYLQEGLDLGVLETEVPTLPRPELIRYLGIEVLVDRVDCLAARITFDLSDIYSGTDPFTSEYVLTPRADEWGFAWSGSGWLCDGPHPLET